MKIIFAFSPFVITPQLIFSKRMPAPFKERDFFYHRWKQVGKENVYTARNRNLPPDSLHQKFNSCSPTPPADNHPVFPTRKLPTKRTDDTWLCSVIGLFIFLLAVTAFLIFWNRKWRFLPAEISATKVRHRAAALLNAPISFFPLKA